MMVQLLLLASYILTITPFLLTPQGALALAKINQQKVKALAGVINLKTKARRALIQQKWKQKPKHFRVRSTDYEDFGSDVDTTRQAFDAPLDFQPPENFDHSLGQPLMEDHPHIIPMQPLQPPEGLTSEPEFSAMPQVNPPCLFGRCAGPDEFRQPPPLPSNRVGIPFGNQEEEINRENLWAMNRMNSGNGGILGDPSIVQDSQMRFADPTLHSGHFFHTHNHVHQKTHGFGGHSGFSNTGFVTPNVVQPAVITPAVFPQTTNIKVFQSQHSFGGGFNHEGINGGIGPQGGFSSSSGNSQLNQAGSSSFGSSNNAQVNQAGGIGGPSTFGSSNNVQVNQAGGIGGSGGFGSSNNAQVNQAGSIGGSSGFGSSNNAQVNQAGGNGGLGGFGTSNIAEIQQSGGAGGWDGFGASNTAHISQSGFGGSNNAQISQTRSSEIGSESQTKKAEKSQIGKTEESQTEKTEESQTETTEESADRKPPGEPFRINITLPEEVQDKEPINSSETIENTTILPLEWEEDFTEESRDDIIKKLVEPYNATKHGAIKGPVKKIEVLPKGKKVRIVPLLHVPKNYTGVVDPGEILILDHRNDSKIVVNPDFSLLADDTLPSKDKSPSENLKEENTSGRQTGNPKQVNANISFPNSMEEGNSDAQLKKPRHIDANVQRYVANNKEDQGSRAAAGTTNLEDAPFVASNLQLPNENLNEHFRNDFYSDPRDGLRNAYFEQGDFNNNNEGDHMLNQTLKDNEAPVDADSAVSKFLSMASPDLRDLVRTEHGAGVHNNDFSDLLENIEEASKQQGGKISEKYLLHTKKDDDKTVLDKQNEMVEKPFLVNVHTNGRSILDMRDADPRQNRMANKLDDVLLQQKQMVNSLQEDAKHNEDLMLISYIGRSVLEDLEQRHNQTKRRGKRQISRRLLPLTRIVSDPNTRLDFHKTLENLGTVARSTFEDKRAPMYHVRSMVGNARDCALSALKAVPCNVFIPSKYQIVRADGSDEKLGSINQKMLNSRTNSKDTEFRNNKDTDSFDPLGVESAFGKIEKIVKNTVNSGKDSFVHAADIVNDAKHVLYTAGHSAPRLLVPKVPRMSSLMKKAILIAPRILDLTDENVEAANQHPEVVGMGNFFDAVGISSPNVQKVPLERIVIEPRNAFTNLKKLRKPEEFRSISPIKEWLRSVMVDNVDEGILEKDDAALEQTLNDLESAKETVGAANLGEFVEIMREGLNTMLRSGLKESKVKRKMKKRRKHRKGKQAENNTGDKNPQNYQSHSQNLSEMPNEQGGVNEEKAVGAGLSLPPQLLHPFMSLPSNDQLNEYLSENGDEPANLAAPQEMEGVLQLPHELTQPFMGHTRESAEENQRRAENMPQEQPTAEQGMNPGEEVGTSMKVQGSLLKPFMGTGINKNKNPFNKNGGWDPEQDVVRPH